MVNKEMAGPQEHVKKYDKYSHLVTKKAEADVERFLLEGHDFDRFAVVCCIAVSVVLTSSSAFWDFFTFLFFRLQEVGKYAELIDDITYNSQKVTLYLPLVQLEYFPLWTK